MEKIVVELNPIYAACADIVNEICAGNLEGEVLRDKRNSIYTVDSPAGLLVVKRFGVPVWLRRVIYTVSSSKARRSYLYARRFEAMGIGTAAPVAYGEVSVGGLFHTGYYISTYIDLPQMDSKVDMTQSEKDLLIDDFAAFTVDLHLKGVHHGDYNPGNIFYSKGADGHYHFQLIDNNRARFHRMCRSRSRKEFARLMLPFDLLMKTAYRYAALRGWNSEMFCAGVLMERNIGTRKLVKKWLKPIKLAIIGRKV